MKLKTANQFLYPQNESFFSCVRIISNFKISINPKLSFYFIDLFNTALFNHFNFSIQTGINEIKSINVSINLNIMFKK